MKHNKIRLPKLPNRLARPFTLAFAAFAGLATASVHASMDTATVQVGEVSLVLGKAWISKPGVARELVRIGTVVHASDSIETATNGHVHIRFVDAALVSIRPSSTLEIVRYDYNPAAPEDSAVKMNLVEGVTRAISGQAAKEARANFRMNTPIAAIGVRGTDFVVSADQRSVRALVNEGAIVVAPFSSQCLMEAFGPCSMNGLELAGGVGQVVQINASGGDPVLLPLAPTGIPQAAIGQSLALVRSVDTQPAEAETGELYTDTVSARAVNPRIAEARPAVRPPLVIPVPEYTPDLAVSAATLTNNQLVWGRWTEGDLGSERITTSFVDAISLNREGTVGNNSYGLFRTEAGTKLVNPGLGILGFALGQAQANYRDASGTSLMDVNGGSLNLDIEARLFSTTLQLNHAATGPLSYSDSGTLSSSGYFRSRSDTQITAGAISIDGKEAGYFFQKTLEQGSIDGLTLWNRLP